MKCSVRLALFCVIVFMILCAGCSSKDNNSKNSTSADLSAVDHIAITDNTGKEVEVPLGIKRVASLAPSETEIFYALNSEEAGIELVARTEYCNYPAEAESVTSVGGPQTLSVEAIVAKQPDLILASTVTDSLVLGELTDLNYPELIFVLEQFEDVYRNIELVGKALDLEDNAAKLISSMKEREQKIVDQAHKTPSPRVMYVVASQPLYVAGNGTIQDQLITKSGGINVFGDAEYYFVASDEAVVERSPDIIIVPSSHGGGKAIVDGILQKQQFSEIPAVKSNHICIVNDDIASRPGPRIIDALELFSECINR